MLVFANHQNKKNLYINGTKVSIKFGDIFIQEGIKVINFNEFFDTVVDDVIISRSSLNGKYISRFHQNPVGLDETISSNLNLKNNVIKTKVRRNNGGKTTRYKLGTICPIQDYFLVAFSRFDDNNRAYLTLDDYFSCLMQMWSELDKYYNGRPISIPLLGGGITRFEGNILKPQELLKYILITFNASKKQFGNTSSLTIVLHESVKEEINLYDITEDLL